MKATSDLDLHSAQLVNLSNVTSAFEAFGLGLRTHRLKTAARIVWMAIKNITFAALRRDLSASIKAAIAYSTVQWVYQINNRLLLFGSLSGSCPTFQCGSAASD